MAARKRLPRNASVDPALEQWITDRSWKAFPFQRQVWAEMARGASGMLHSSTGSGKTLAVWLGALGALRAEVAPEGAKAKPPPLAVLWITPMRALAADTLRSLEAPMQALAPGWSSGLRSGDTTSAQRAAQDRRLPTVLVTTPESLTLLLARADARELMRQVRVAVVDEWHELMGNKRGVQTQLALARLRTFQPALMTWGLSATLGNLNEALRTLLGSAPWPAERAPVMVQGETDKTLVIDTLLPAAAERFAWAGHMGLRMLPQVIQAIEDSASCLVFTNMRSQAERWYRALLEARPDWAGVLALHHGSLDRGVREWVELGLKEGRIKAAVCTSSLDLGVDFLPVDRVLQIGSAKGVARLVQRAGRAGHAPGRPSRITLVPTHSLELVEAAAARAAVAAGQVEAREPPAQPLDVLVQHLVTVALGGGFRPDALYAEVRQTHAYAQLDAQRWQWCLDFVRQGGAALAAYPDYRRVVPDAEGIWRVPEARLARRHRANIGTIVSDASMAVQFVGGARIGSVEESFAARLKPGEAFVFGGRLLELVRIHEMTAWVRRASGRRAAVPRWNGGRMPLSSTLADAVVAALAAAGAGRYESPEMRSAQPLLALQQRWSALPTPDSLLAEVLKSREGWHLFLYPFAGRQVHLGLASLLAWRAAQVAPRSFSIAVNDYGIELLCATAIDWPALLPALLHQASDGPTLLAEVLASLNAGALAQRRFREIARVAGLIFQSHPGERRSSRQLQASSALFWEVFRNHDPANLLLRQAEQELLAQELELGRLQAALARMAGQRLVLHTLARPTPFAFPLMVERFREQLSSERVADRIARMLAQLERAAGGQAGEGAARVQAGLQFGQQTDQPSDQARGAPAPRKRRGRR